MKTTHVLALTSALLLVACSDATPPASAPVAAATTSQAPATSNEDAELAALKNIQGVDACKLLSVEKLKAHFPDLEFKLHQALEPRLSGYAWDSRCSFWAGVGSVEYAKDVPTHTIDIAVNTVISADKAQANLKSRQELAAGSNDYQKQDSLGQYAYSARGTGVITLFFVVGQTEFQLNISDLSSSPEQKLAKLMEIAKAMQ